MEDSSTPPQSDPPVYPVQPPPGLPPQIQAVENQDAEHLKVLSICYYVMSGLSVLGAFFTVFYVIMGGMMMSGSFPGSGPSSSHAASELRMMGGMFLAIGLIGTLIILVMAALEFVVARKLVRRQSKMLCFVVAGLNCLNMPLGTVLGVFTFLVLTRPSVAESFARNENR